ncbi:MAG: acyl-CoA thioesterase [Chloroflexota bacterium]|nr:acyl-CoA thioesterase [Chloroflexota bacterium]
MPDQNRPPQPTVEVITTDHVLPGNTNSYGTMFGGDVLALMDKTAAIAALRFCRQPVVTASTERIDFRMPIHLGDIIEARARVIHTGRTSIIVRIDIWDERPLTGERELCTTGYYSFVSIDADGRPQPVPPLDVRTPEEQADWDHGEEIRAEIKARREARQAGIRR